MIFKKEAIFPYPVLFNDSSDYVDQQFDLSIDLYDIEDSIKFGIKYELTSKFIQGLLKSGEAKMYIIVESKDCKFAELDDDHVVIPKNRISLNRRTNIQLVVSAHSNIDFSGNNELDRFYAPLKHKIRVEKHNILAFSNVEQFSGDLKKPFDLFEKRLDSSIDSDIKIELGTETIIIVYRKDEFQFRQFNKSNALNNHYVYIGLQRALTHFIIDLSDEENEVYLDNIDDPENQLYFKLYNLLLNKDVHILSLDELDKIISKISDRIIEKHVWAIGESILHGN